MSAPEQQPVNFLEQARQKTELDSYDTHINQNLALVKQSIFGIPADTPEGEFVKNAYDRLHAKEGYTKLQERILFAFQKRLEQIRDLVVKTAREKGLTIRETNAALGNKEKQFTRMVIVMGQALKTNNEPYGKTNQTGPGADRQMLDVDEAVMLERFALMMETLDFKEILSMIVEDQPMISALMEAQKQQAESVRDTVLPQGDKDKFIVNYDELRDFILARPNPVTKNKPSPNRRLMEHVMWTQIVRNLTPPQQKDLVRSFLADPSGQAVANTKNFIRASIISGAMSRESAMYIYGRPGSVNDDPSIREKLDPDGKSFADFITVAVNENQEARGNMEWAAKQVERPIKSFVEHYFHLDNLIASRGIDIGVITATVATVLGIGDAFRLNQGKSFAEKLAIGLKDVASDKFFWGGIGLASVASDHILPWLKDASLSPSKAEKNQLALVGEVKVLHDKLLEHPAMQRFFELHYDGYLAKAAVYNSEGKEALIDPKDVEISKEEAQDMGFSTVAEAQATAARLFKICTRDLKDQKLASSKKLHEYIGKVIYSAPPNPPNKIV